MSTLWQQVYGAVDSERFIDATKRLQHLLAAFEGGTLEEALPRLTNHRRKSSFSVSGQREQPDTLREFANRYAELVGAFKGELSALLEQEYGSRSELDPEVLQQALAALRGTNSLSIHSVLSLAVLEQFDEVSKLGARVGRRCKLLFEF